MIQLPKLVRRPAKRKGRGIGSGKGGHTSSRGQKGQKSRRSIPVLFEGMKTKRSLLKRLPKLRGKGKNKSRINRKHKSLPSKKVAEKSSK